MPTCKHFCRRQASGDSERQRFSVPGQCAGSGERSRKGSTVPGRLGCAGQGEAELHGKRSSREVSLGRHMVAVLIGAKMCVCYSKGSKQESTEGFNLESAELIHCRSHANYERAAWRRKGCSRSQGVIRPGVNNANGKHSGPWTNIFSRKPIHTSWRVTDTAEGQEGGVSGNTQVS